MDKYLEHQISSIKFSMKYILIKHLHELINVNIFF
jgi:hypothetical protein